MKFSWTNEAFSDLARLYDFLALVNQQAAIRVVRNLTNTPMRLLENPRIGRKLAEFEPREVRRIIISHYEIRYEIQDNNIYILRIWHVREDRYLD